MDTNALLRVISVLVSMPLFLFAQDWQPRDSVPLKHWPAPLYWQPAQAAEEHAGLAPEASLPATANPLVFVAMTPCRVVDTRVTQGLGSFGSPSLVGGASRTFRLPSSKSCSIPAVAQAYSFNITVVPPGPLGFITAYPTGKPVPLAATLNSVQGYIVGNAAVVPAGADGSIDIYASDRTDIVIDINGYYAAITDAVSGNVAVGTGALSENTGIKNTATGFQALQNNATGVHNTASGNEALQSNTTGSGNTANGAEALLSNTTGTTNTAFGDEALHNNISGNSNTAIGAAALVGNTSGSGNIAIGYLAGVSAPNLDNATVIGYQATVNASNKIRFGNASVSVIEGQVAYTFTSDRNLKENFRPVNGEQTLKKIGGLSLTSWNYIGQDANQFRHYGPVAQQFFAAFGHDGVGTAGTPTTINSGDMEGILMIAVQALEKRTDKLGALTAEIADLRARLEKQVQEKARLTEIVELLKLRLEKLERMDGLGGTLASIWEEPH